MNVTCIMKEYFHIAFTIFVLGVLVVPKQSLACDNMKGNSEMACCKKQQSNIKSLKKNSSNQHSCCSSKKNASDFYSTKQKNKTKKNCDDCDQNYCSCAPVILGFVIPAHFILENKIFIPSKVSQKSSYIETYVSSGFHFIWQPPKLV